MENHLVTSPKPYSKFARCLNDWPVFEKAASDNSHWFSDLLSLWCPSGLSSGKDGLRLAIRNGYINFYRLGQSVAKVECLGDELIASVHYKYVLSGPPPGMPPKSPYLRLTQNKMFFRGDPVADYVGSSTLGEWIARINAEYADPEKSIVDQLVGKNDNIVDLEMALPAWTYPKVAVRMDLVAIEGSKVVFWEVKTVNDARIRCRAEFEMDEFPEVLEQLSKYLVYLKQPTHEERVESAYLETARLLVEFRKLADKFGPVLPLGQSIIQASKSYKLEVADQAALVVVDLIPKDKPLETPWEASPAWSSWTVKRDRKMSHEEKLKGRIPLRVLKQPGPLIFEGAL